MATTRPVSPEASYIASRAHPMKARWEKELGRPLELQTERLMPGPRGQTYRADIVLQDPEGGLPVVVFEVKSPGKTREQAEANLRRILDTRRFVELLGGETPRVVLVVPLDQEDEGRQITHQLGAGDVFVEVF